MADSPQTFEKNSFVFITDEREVYVPAKVVEAFVQGKPDGKVSRLDQGLGMVNLGIETLSQEASENVLPMDEASTRAQTNMVNLKTINNAAILHNIRMRFRGDQVYTNVGDILISVNPYKYLPLFTPDVIERYKLHGYRDEPPHVYGVADKTWRAIANAGSDDSVRDQAVIVQGESGSGKTEVTKLFLQYVAEMSGGIRTLKEIARGAEAPIQEQILRANPLLEAFGNSKTQRNDNSSRFGKFVEVVFSRSGEILGGTITQYLLEKSRIVEQSTGERNYHIFYQLLAGANKDAKLKALHRLGEPDEYYYLNQGLWDAGPSSKQQEQEAFTSGGKRRRPNRINDESDWEDMCASMEVMDMSSRERDAVFQCVAAILHLGNIHFEVDPNVAGGGAKVANPDQLQFVAKELGCSAELLTSAFCSRTIRVDKKTITASRTVEAAETARDSLAKDLYAKLFKWLIDRINHTLTGGGKKLGSIVATQPGSSKPVQQQATVTERKGFLGLFGRMKTAGGKVPAGNKEITIGILDIFGFEQIDPNSFEQLCINYCNEKLNSFFIQQVFAMEQEEYAREGIKVPQVDFSHLDSDNVLKLFEAKPAGIFSLLEDEVKMNSNSDDGFVLKLFQYNQHSIPHILAKASVKEENAHVCFTIQHFADRVTYDSTNLVHKNKAAIPKELVLTARSSTLVFMRELFGDVPFGSAAKQQIERAVSFNESMSASHHDEDVSEDAMGPDGPGSRRSFTSMKPQQQQQQQQQPQLASVVRKNVEAVVSAATARPVSTNRRASFLPAMLTMNRSNAEKPGAGALKSLVEKEAEEEDASDAAGGQTTLMVQFKSQLDDLLRLLNVCDPHFIRCIKPNDEMRGNKFNSVLVMDQIKVAGILPIANIRQWGFPVRFTFNDFLQRFKSLDPQRGKRDEAKTGKQLSEALRLNANLYRLGKTKVFCKNSLALELEIKRDVKLTSQAITLQRMARGHIARIKFRQHHQTLDDLVSAMLSRNFAQLNRALQNTAELPNHGRHLDTVKDARMLQTRLSEEERIVRILTNAMENRDLTMLLAGMAAAREIKLGSPVLLNEVQPMIEKLTAQRQVHQTLVHAVQSNDMKTIAAAMALATKVDAIHDEAFHQCVAIKSRQSEMAQVMQDLERASKSRSLPQLNALLARSVVLGVSSTTNDASIVKYRQIRQAVRHEEAVCRMVDFAVERRDEQDLKAALQKAEALKSIKPERLQAAKELKQVMEKESLAIKQLAQANLKNDPTAIELALQHAESIGLDHHTSNQVLEASRNKDRLKAKEVALAQLNKVVLESSTVEAKQKPETKIATLTIAMLEATLVGASTGRTYNEATLLLKTFGRRGDLAVQICDNALNGDAEQLEANIKLWKKEGLPDEAMQIPRQILADLRNEHEMAKQLTEAMSLGDIAAITKLLAEIEEGYPQFAKRNHYTYEKTKGVVAALRASSLAYKYRDLSLLEQCLQLAVRAGVQNVGPVARLEDLKLKLVKEREFAAKLPLDNIPQLREMLKLVPFDLKDDAYDEVLDARAEVDRYTRMEKAFKLIDEANAESDLKKLNLAIHAIIDLGLAANTTKQVDVAFQLRTKLESQQEMIGQLVAEVDTMRIRMQNRQGIVVTDLAHVLECLHNAKAKGISPGAKQYQACVVLSEKMRRQLVIQEELRNALVNKDFISLKLSMDHAQEAEVEIELAQQVRAMVRILDAKRRLAQKTNAANVAGREAKSSHEDAAAQATLNDKNSRAEYEQKLQKSSGVRYKWERFTDIRTDEDYSKGSSKKQRVIDTKLVSQSTLIPKSLLVLDKQLNKVALKINKDILGYCGDRAMSFPPSLARDMLQKSADNPLLANESYVQLCKHITKNPKADSAGRAWQLMCMCVSSFPPSVDFELYLLNFLQSNVNVPGLVSNYARFALRRLEGMMTTGASGTVPSIEEIAAYKERPPILATIQLVDGTPLTQGLPVTPDLDAEKVVDLCIHFLGLKDPRAKQLFAIFVVDDTERKKETQMEEKRWQHANETGKKPLPIENPSDLPRTAKFLQKNEFLGSVIVQMTRLKHDFTFVFKRKLHLGEVLEIKANHSEDDPMYKKLIYLQAQESFISGELGIHDLDQIVQAMSVAVAADNDSFPDSIERLLDDADVLSYVPKPYRRAKTDRDWAKAVLNSGAQYASDPSEYLQDKFVDILKRQELYGAMFFHALRASESPDVVSLPNHIVLAVNALGVHLLDAENRRKGIVRTIRFDQIKRWGGSAKYFSFSVLKDLTSAGADKSAYELALNTPQAAELSVVMTEYVNSLVGSGMLTGFSKLDRAKSRRGKALSVKQ